VADTALDLLRAHLSRNAEMDDAGVVEFITRHGRPVAWQAAEELDALLDSQPTGAMADVERLLVVRTDLWSAILREGRATPGGSSGESGVREPRHPRPGAPAAAAALDVPTVGGSVG
jgi:hypothetical protein